MSKISRLKGFTLLETLIVIGVTAVVASVGVSSYVSQQKAKVLDNTAQEIVGYLRYAQQKSIAQEQGEQWGIHFENPAEGKDFYALYTGAAYSSPAETKYLPAGITFQTPTSGNSVDMSLSKLTGFLTDSSYQQIILEDASGRTINVLICKQGLIASNKDIEICGDIDTTPPEIGEVIASNVLYNSYVDSPFDLSASVSEPEGGLLSCEYTINGGVDWNEATKSGTGPLYTCTKTGITASDGASLSLNMRSTSEGGTGTGTSVTRTVDATSPICSDNYEDNSWVAGSSIDITVSCNDDKSGVASTKYCIDTANTCSPASSYTTSVSVTCALGNNCIQYFRYNAQDNVNNTSTIYSTRVRQDTKNPTATDNWTDNWTSTSPVSVTITPSDGSGSGIKATYYCIDTANTCTPTTSGTVASVSCASGSICSQYVRYYTKDNANNVSSTYSKRVRQDKQVPTDGTLSAVADNQKVSLSWTAASDGSGSGLASSNTYKLVYLTSGYPAANCTTGNQIYLGTGTSYSHTGLTNDTTYYYRLCAYDVVGNISTGSTKSAMPEQILLDNGETCALAGECLSGYCYVDNDGDRYAPSSGTKKCQPSSQLSGIDCDDNNASIYPGVVVGVKDCDYLNYYYIYGTQSSTTTSYCRYRNYADENKVCQADGTISNPSCSSYTTSTYATCGTCQYVGSCTSSLKSCADYSGATSCGTCSTCRLGNCVTCTWQYAGSDDIRASGYQSYISCDITNANKLVWSMTGGGCGSKASEAITNILYTPVTVNIQKCVCQ
ncbi:MAG: type II secretion system protein [Candidatus Paceibacterota bacterium]|jgi:type II secretory pathway pseudopilin PulG